MTSQGTAESAVRLINIRTKDAAASTQVTRALLSVGAPGSVDDVAYYSPGSLCVAAGGQVGEQAMSNGEGGGGCIALLPLEDAEWSPVSPDAVTQGWEQVDVQSTEGSQVLIPSSPLLSSPLLSSPLLSYLIVSGLDAPTGHQMPRYPHHTSYIIHQTSNMIQPHHPKL